MGIFLKLLIFYIIICLLFSGILCAFDYSHFYGITKEEDQGIDKFYNRLYFVFTTISTVGYGDITPKSKITRFIVSIIMISISFTVFQAIYEYFENIIQNKLPF